MNAVSQKQKVLLVEDDPLIALDAAQTIEELGLECLVAHDPREALELIAAAMVDCALLDFNLGGETSVPVAQRLEADGCPFAVVTGRQHDEVVEAMPPRTQVLSKPADYGQIALSLLKTIAA